jgi:hypothetical protein
MRYGGDMAQRGTKRIGFVVHQPHPGLVARLHGPAPVDKWGESGETLWGDLEGAGLPVVPLRVEYRPTDHGAEDVEVYALASDDLRVRLDLTFDRPARVVAERRDGRPLSERDMRRLGLGHVNKALERTLNDPVAAAHLGGKRAVKLPRPGARGQTDEYYAVWALDYVKALGVAPTKPVRHMLDQLIERDERTKRGEHYTVAVVRNLLQQARRRGLLTEGAAGRAGGELTDKARVLLDKEGLL